jgi:hypothetical protein
MVNSIRLITMPEPIQRDIVLMGQLAPYDGIAI